MHCLSLFPGGLLSAGSAFEVTTNLAWKLPQHLPCLLWWELASKIGTPHSVSSRLVVTYSELLPSQLFLLRTFFNIYGDSRVEILPVDECTHFNAWCEVECFPLSLPLSPLLSPHQCLPVRVLTQPVAMSSLYACHCLRPYHKGYLLGAVAGWSLLGSWNQMQCMFWAEGHPWWVFGQLCSVSSVNLRVSVEFVIKINQLWEKTSHWLGGFKHL